jgi:hypothetical protein
MCIQWLTRPPEASTREHHASACRPDVSTQMPCAMPSDPQARLAVYAKGVSSVRRPASSFDLISAQSSIPANRSPASWRRAADLRSSSYCGSFSQRCRRNPSNVGSVEQVLHGLARGGCLDTNPARTTARLPTNLACVGQTWALMTAKKPRSARHTGLL